MTTKTPSRKIALTLAVALMLPALALPASAQFGFGRPKTPAQAKPGMSTKKKVVLLAGAALLYYLYNKHKAAQQAQATTAPGRTAAAPRANQLYRSRNGGIYYRDAQNKPVWVTAPAGGVQVSAADVQRYAPRYARYQGQSTPPAPRGYRTQSATEYDPSLAYNGDNGGGMMAPSGPRGPM